MAAIFVASSIPDLAELPGGVSDQTGHFVGYALLGALLAARARGARVAGRHDRAPLRSHGSSASAYGATDEFHQSFVPGRTPDVDDWVADIARRRGRRRRLSCAGRARSSAGARSRAV